ncbi:MAG: tetraacyldisaccharide 4'-kinase [Pseudomonadota bacterium]
MSTRLIRHWYQHRLTLLTLILLPFSYLFIAIVYLRQRLYAWGLLKTSRFPVPIIVVGNITVGGTGKTPLVIYLVQQLQKMGHRPAIVSRGYGGSAKTTLLVNADTDPRHCGDEPALMARRLHCPIVIGASRVQAVKKLLENVPTCTIIISDDGLQHYALARAIEIALIDGQRQLGNRRCLPAGPLRELPARLKQVDFVVTNGKSAHHFDHDATMRLQADHHLHHVNDQPKKPCGDIRAKTVHAIAAIANPQRFFDTLRQLGFTIIAHSFPDHYFFKKEDICFSDDKIVIMTEKDAVKCRRFADQRHYYLPVNADFDNDFCQMILNRLTDKGYPCPKNDSN